MTTDNVRHLPTSRTTRALACARAIQPGWLDRILIDEHRNLTALDKGTGIINGLAAAGQAVWLRRDAEARAEQAIRCAVRLEQQLSEIEQIAIGWTGLSGVTAGMGHLLLDVIRSDRGDEDGRAS